jgi:hypothetical protein
MHAQNDRDAQYRQQGERPDQRFRDAAHDHAPAGLGHVLDDHKEVGPQRYRKAEGPSDQVGEVELVRIGSPAYGADDQAGNPDGQRQQPGGLRPREAVDGIGVAGRRLEGVDQPDQRIASFY